MQSSILHFQSHGQPTLQTALLASSCDGWQWLDVVVDGDADYNELLATVADWPLDPLAVRDAAADHDAPKVDDFGESLLLVLHALSRTAIETYEIDCFIAPGLLLTVRHQDSPAVETLWELAQSRPDIAKCSNDEVLAMLADVVARRLVYVLAVFEERSEELVELALAAEKSFLGEVMAVRKNLAEIRRSIRPQREALDLIRRMDSHLLGAASRRRFSDVFDVTTRTADGVDYARGTLAETLDTYAGAEARRATRVSTVLTIYAAIMLPLTLVVGFFGMNFANIPLTADPNGWLYTSIAMSVVTVISLGLFVGAGWIERPSGRRAGQALGRGLIEAAHTPTQVVGAIFEMSTMPVRLVGQSVVDPIRARRQPHADEELD